MYENAITNNQKIFAIAPMMDWTDRHCRFFHRAMTKHALLYSEMVVADAIIHGDKDQLLGGDKTSGPIALQLGGSDPEKLAKAVQLAEPYGYDEINLNVGCPSDRVQSGTFGACLMREPELVGNCVAAMKAETRIPVTVKCRIGVDDQDTGVALNQLAECVWGAGCDALWIHARKAWREGLSPKENRDVPPLDYDRVRRLKQKNMSHFIGLNGGLKGLNHGLKEMIQGDVEFDGMMLGRVAYQSSAILREVDQLYYHSAEEPVSYSEIIEAMCKYAEEHINSGGRLHHITRHMVGLFQSVPGVRRWRQILSTEATKYDAKPDIIRQAFNEVSLQAENCAA